MAKTDLVFDKIDFTQEFDVLETQKNKAFEAFNKASKSSNLDVASKHANAYISSLDMQIEISPRARALDKISYSDEFDRLTTVKEWARKYEAWAKPFGEGTALESLCRTAYADATKMQIKVGRAEFLYKHSIGEIGKQTPHSLVTI